MGSVLPEMAKIGRDRRGNDGHFDPLLHNDSMTPGLSCQDEDCGRINERCEAWLILAMSTI